VFKAPPIWRGRRAKGIQHPYPTNLANKGIVDMADIKLTHIEEYSQGLSYPIPVLKELGVWKRALYRRTRPALRVANVAEDKEFERKFSCMIKGEGLPPKDPLPFLTLS